MIDKNCHLVFLEQVSQLPVDVRLRLSSLWSRWWMCKRDGLFGVRVTRNYEVKCGRRSSIREDFLTVDTLVLRLGFRKFERELMNSGAGLGCEAGSKKEIVLIALSEIVKEELR